MLGWVDNIEKLTLENGNFRKVLFTGTRTQLVVMSVNVGEDIGWEVHPDNDQFFRLEQGKIRLDLGKGKSAVDETHEAEDAWAFVIPSGTWHNIVNIGTKPVRLYTLYSPPHHAAGTIHVTKADAEASQEHY